MVRLNRSDVVIRPDVRRVVARLFIPGFAGTLDALGGARVDPIVQRTMELSEAEIHQQLADSRRLFAGRHRDLERLWEANFLQALPHSPRMKDAGPELRALLGAIFTQEYAFEASAVCNPSIVPYPVEQQGDSLRFVMSARAIGEGHISSIEFRTGSVSSAGTIQLDDVDLTVEVGGRTSVTYRKGAFLNKLEELGADPAIALDICDALPSRFTFDDLAAVLPNIDSPTAYPAVAFETIRLIHWLASSNYRLEFEDGRIGDRLIFPAGPADSHGMEDARFVALVEDDGSTSYYATYTAYDGFQILPQLIQTPDFRHFDITTMSGDSARNKGIALFPTKFDGSYAALSRLDREKLYLTFSDDVRSWETSQLIYEPTASWEMVQIGNCGSPLETSEGWLVLTHGVGPMRRYCIGAILLDRKDPSQVLGRLRDPLIEPEEAFRDGYVPNVVYSCGGLIHSGNLILPYGLSDHSIAFGVAPVVDLLEAMA
ncbi:MAG TPA: glycoside hydrolase family 130 protein [Acidimicrobiia bacterium]|nr:glycoside hydrolase family 130 protein [Acidimicrobiia bacterium]